MRRAPCRGLGLIDLLAGVAVGLVVAAAASAFTLTQVREDRDALARHRLLRELRMASDVIAHDLRRAGHWGGAAPPAWRSVAAGPARANPYAALTPASAASDAVQLAYAQTPGDHDVQDDERLGFRVRRGVVEMMLGLGQWQALTDAATVVVTQLEITPSARSLPLEALCPAPCPATSTGPACGPVQSVREVAITLRGHAPSAPEIERTLSHRVRVRNDLVAGDCPAAP